MYFFKNVHINIFKTSYQLNASEKCKLKSVNQSIPIYQIFVQIYLDVDLLADRSSLGDLLSLDKLY